MSATGTLARHARNNSLAKILVTVAGLVSFPLLTRVLNVEDYGVMNLIASALALAVGVGKLGMQQAALRFYSDTRAGKIPGVTLPVYMPTVIYGMAGTGLVATLLWLLASVVLPAWFEADARVGPLMRLTAVLVVCRVLYSGIQNILWAQERSGLLAMVSVVYRYASLALILGAVFLISPSLWSFYGATVISEVVLLGVVGWWVLRSGISVNVRQFSPDLLRQMIVFAIPMAGYELASVVLQLSDRYVQNHFLGAEAVGLYSAGYNLSDYIRLALFTAMISAVQPMGLRMHAEQGAHETSRFLARISHLYFAGALLVVALVSSVRVEMLTILASPKYLPAAPVIPWLISGMMFEAYFAVAGFGNYLRKRSLTMMSIIASGALLNLLLNVLLVPQLGIVGSGVANVASCLSIVIIARRYSRRALAMPRIGAMILKFALVAVAAYFVGQQVHYDHVWVTMIVRGWVVLFVYGGLASLVDAGVRRAIAQGARRLPSLRRRVAG